MAEIPDWLIAHRKLMVEHILFLDESNSDYANYAVASYIKEENCPFPELKKAVIDELAKRQQKAD